MDQTFQQLWMRLRVYAPDIPVVLAQEFVNTAYSRALNYHLWTGLRKVSAIIIPLVYNTGTVTVVQNSTTVTGAATVWTAAMVGRQFYSATDTTGSGSIAPYYTITAVNTIAQTLTLDRGYEKADAAGIAYNIQLVLAAMPSDFLRIDTVVDIVNNWKLHTNFRQEQIDVWDAKRSVSGTTWILAQATPLVQTNNTVLQRYELWPRTLPGPRTFPMRYISKPPLMSAASDRPIYPIRGDILRKGGLAELAAWPGTTEYRNPYFNMEIHRTFEKEFEDGLNGVVREDNELSQRAVWYEDYEGVPYAPIDARYLQTHDIF